MTPLDAFVKEGMLSFAEIFPTRLAVLTHLYLVLGNGYEWNSQTGQAERDLDDENEHIDIPNIDVLASSRDPSAATLPRHHYTKGENVVSYYRSGYCLAELPAVVEPSFKAGALEILDAVISIETDPAIIGQLNEIKTDIVVRKEIK